MEVMMEILPSSSNIITNKEVDRINKSFEELKISYSINPQDVNRSCKAGTINNVIITLDTILVQPQSLNNLLYLGTPLFLKRVNPENCLTSDYILIGTIDDIFGPVSQPLYKIQITELPMDVLNIGDEVYYLIDNSRTRYMELEKLLDRKNNNVKHRIRTIRKRKIHRSRF